MTLEQAFQLSLQRFDDAVAKLRVMAADPAHINLTFGTAKDAFDRVAHALMDLEQVKAVWHTAKERAKETTEHLIDDHYKD